MLKHHLIRANDDSNFSCVDVNNKLKHYVIFCPNNINDNELIEFQDKPLVNDQ